MKWRQIKRQAAGVLSAFILICTVLTGCRANDKNKVDEAGASDLAANLASDSNLLRSKALADLNQSLEGRLISARYTAPYYHYALDFPGLLRVDDQGFLTCGHIRGNLHRVSLDTIIGPVNLLHPQEGHDYPVATLAPDSQETESSNGTDQKAAVTCFRRQDFADGEALLKEFYLKTVLFRAEVGPAARLDLTRPSVDEKEKIGSFEWYHLAYPLIEGQAERQDEAGDRATADSSGGVAADLGANSSGRSETVETAPQDPAEPASETAFEQTVLHLFAAVIQDIPFIFTYQTESLATRYQAFEYLPLRDYSTEIEQKVPDLLRELLGSINFYEDAGEVLGLFDAGNLLTDPRGGRPVYELARPGGFGGGKTAEVSRATGSAGGARPDSPAAGLHYSEARLPDSSCGYYMVKTKQLSDRITDQNDGLPKQTLLPDLVDLLTLQENQKDSAAEEEEAGQQPGEQDFQQGLPKAAQMGAYLADEKPAPVYVCSWNHPILRRVAVEIFHIPAAAFGQVAAAEVAVDETGTAEETAGADDPDKTGGAGPSGDAYLLCFRTENYVGYILDRTEAAGAESEAEDNMPDVRLNGLLVSAGSLIEPAAGESLRSWTIADLLQAEQNKTNK